MIRISQPLIGEAERQAVLDVLASGRLANGPVTRQLEEAFAAQVSRTEHAVAVSSGTAALHVALLAHDIGPGDEVITTPFSFQASSNMILATGARPVFVDVNEDGNLDPSRVEAAIAPATKAMLPVHLYGRACDMTAVSDIATRYGLVIIEDAAQSHGATCGGKPVGSFGTGCFSLYATKNVTAGEGGIITTNDGALAERFRSLRSHGERDRYESSELGFNYRLPEISAALALAQLPYLDEMTRKRRENAKRLSKRLLGLQLPAMPNDPQEHVWHQFTVRVPHGRDELLEHLRGREIEAGVYYPMPLPAQKLYRDLGYSVTAFPMAQRLAAEVLSLPVHPGLSDADIDLIADAVNEWTSGS